MKRGKCLVNCIELDLPLALLADVISPPESQNVSEVKTCIVEYIGFFYLVRKVCQHIWLLI